MMSASLAKNVKPGRRLAVLTLGRVADLDHPSVPRMIFLLTCDAQHHRSEVVGYTAIPYWLYHNGYLGCIRWVL